MQKSFPTFIEAIHRYPDYFQSRQLLALLNDPDIEALKTLGLLKRGSDLDEVICASCDDGHFLEVRIEGDRLYCLCPTSDTARNYLEPQDVETWHFEVGAFLQQMALQLGIDDRVEKLTVQSMWQVGGTTQDGIRHTCYYYQGKNIGEALAFIQSQPSQMRRYVLFTNKEALFSITTEHELVAIPTNELANFKKELLTIDKKLFDEYLVNGFRNVIFRKNGDLIANGETIASLTPSTPEYYFVELLWENFNEPVADKKIEGYIYEKAKKEYADTAEKLCNKLKGKIKKASIAPDLIDEIFSPTSDLDGKNAYIMRNPA